MKSPDKVTNHIINWLKDYLEKSNLNGFIAGVSGGIDSALTATLCAKTGYPVKCLEMPIHQNKFQNLNSSIQINWLKSNFPNVTSDEVNLSNVFDEFIKITTDKSNELTNLALANTRARLRMLTLYYYSTINRYLVAGTGNKVEDFGIGFYTKYGDGGVDISPIADLLKTEVYQLSKSLGINNEILIAPPTDGLWNDDKTDEEQIGATYSELEWAMLFNGKKKGLNTRQERVLKIYMQLNKKNQHKMKKIPVCKIPKILK
mgnify:CR=1 FL=1